jgi:hypothetical protein
MERAKLLVPGEFPVPMQRRLKSRTLTCISALALFAALAIQVRLAAQEQKKDHTRYKLIVMRWQRRFESHFLMTKRFCL